MQIFVFDHRSLQFSSGEGLGLQQLTKLLLTSQTFRLTSERCFIFFLTSLSFISHKWQLLQRTTWVLEVESQTMQFNSRKIMLNNFVTYVVLWCRPAINCNVFFALHELANGWRKIDALILHYVAINKEIPKEKLESIILHHETKNMNKLCADGRWNACKMLAMKQFRAYLRR